MCAPFKPRNAAAVAATKRGYLNLDIEWMRYFRESLPHSSNTVAPQLQNKDFEYCLSLILLTATVLL